MKTFIPLLFPVMALTGMSGYGQSIGILKPVVQVKNLTDMSIAGKQKSVALPNIPSLFGSTPTACQPGNCNPLPVKLLSFEGERIDINNVVLKWKTTSEVNNLGFDVERSLGNTSQFVAIAFVRAIPDGGLVKNYLLPDANSFAGTSYYRLKQIDIDSQFVYSKIIAINNTGQEESLTCYPNPAKDMLNLKIVSRNSGNARILLCDVMGKIMVQQSPVLQKGGNLQQMNVSNLAAGMYFVRIYTGEGGTVLVGAFLKN